MPETGAAFARLSVALLFGAWIAPTMASGQTPVLSLDTVTVSVASRLPGGGAGRAVTILERDVLQTLPVTTVAQALRYVVGSDVQSRSPAQSDLSLRGSSFEGVVVMVDGVRMSDPQSGHFDFDLAVPLERVERIEVLLGPASAQFGADADGGVVNIVTRSGGDAADVRAEGGSFGSWLAAGGARREVGRWAFVAGGELSRSDGHRDGTDFRTDLVEGNVVRRIGEGRVQLSASHGRRDFGAADFYGPYPAYERTRTSTGSASWSARVDRTAIDSRAFFRRHEDDFILRRDDPSFYRNRHTSDQWGGDVVARLAASSRWNVALGGEWARESLRSNSLGNRSEDRSAAFAELTSSFGRARATAGLRVDDREAIDAIWSPSVSASWLVQPSLRLRAALGRAFRAPTWTERYYQDPANTGTPTLEPERSWTGEAGFDASIGERWFARGTLFRRESSNLIDWAKPESDPSEPWRTRNVTRATFDGIELSGRVLLTNAFHLGARGEWLDVRSTAEAGMTSKYALRPLVRTLGARIEWRTDRASASVDGRTERRRGGDSVELLDARASVWVDAVEVFVAGTNLTNAEYLDLTGRSAEGPRITAGVRASWGRAR